MISSVLAGDVRQTLEQFQRSVDQMFQNFYGLPQETGRATPNGTGSEWRFSPAVESAWTDTSLTLRVILPGVPQNEVKVSVQNNQLIIEGERKAPEVFHKNGHTQLAYGRFYTAATLPAGMDLNKLSCHLRDGVLEVQIPVSEQMKPKQIQIQTGEPQRKSISA
ncbi:MAG TPA: Hsp20/alpha crystallin family protein [Bryobacteraceae bacterium]|jgi:HSP20 family protein|nr:Hsp20/alpha crystallin family protein [Bryobacteraceae bacterium]